MVRTEEHLLTQSELGDRAFRSWYLTQKLGNPQNTYVNSYVNSFVFCIGFQAKSVIVYFEMLYLRAQIELEDVLGL